jgi:host factor-I protein
MANNIPNPWGPPRYPRYVPPLESTDAENYYYTKQINEKTPLVVVLAGGEEVEGALEWYDRRCFTLHCPDGRHLLIYKHAVDYICKKEMKKGNL